MSKSTDIWCLSYWLMAAKVDFHLEPLIPWCPNVLTWTRMAVGLRRMKLPVKEIVKLDVGFHFEHMERKVTKLLWIWFIWSIDFMVDTKNYQLHFARSYLQWSLMSRHLYDDAFSYICLTTRLVGWYMNSDINVQLTIVQQTMKWHLAALQKSNESVDICHISAKYKVCKHGSVMTIVWVRVIKIVTVIIQTAEICYRNEGQPCSFPNCQALSPGPGQCVTTSHPPQLEMWRR